MMLTREQVEQIKPLKNPTIPSVKIDGDWVGIYTAFDLLLDTDAALRAEIERLSKQFVDATAREGYLEKQIERLTQERDRFKADGDTYFDRSIAKEKVIDELKQQLAEAQQHLEEQRQATYRAVEREHGAKRDLATAQADLSELQALHRDKYDRWKQAEAEAGRLRGVLQHLWNSNHPVNVRSCSTCQEAQGLVQEAHRGGETKEAL